MVPLSDRAREGRVNPKGIPCLYLATHKDTALSEVRPGKGSLISVAQFQTCRDLTIINVTTHRRPKHLYGSIPKNEIDQLILYRIAKRSQNQ
ncbi:RES family NAD+ phosphorylase [Candidatus Binatus sp.]|uniref:RES family NAD+ phosphorylase n=1 Tax=Candidatus Binatus sp. TaxID=2811406 RepID=UPI003C7588C3